MISARCTIRLAPLAALVAISGCAGVRQTASIIDPVQVYVGDYGVHSSLFLPTADQRFVEYAFGDWGYAVENRNLPQDAIGALTVSRGAGFGRIYHERAGGTNTPDPPRKPFTLHAVTCERSDVLALIDRLDVRFEQLRDRHGPAVINPETGMSWVREDPDKRYSIANNCNHMTAAALQELGCRVTGLVVWSKFRVAEEPSPPIKPAVRTVEKIPGWAAIE